MTPARPVLALCAAALLVSLSACSGSTPDDAPVTSAPVEEPEEATEFDVPFTPFEEIPAEVTAPGTQLALGDVAHLLSENGVDVAASILRAEPQDASYWERFSNPEEFAGSTAFVYVYQFEVLTEIEGEVEELETPRLELLLADGTTASSVFGATDLCPLTLDEVRIDERTFDPQANLMCKVAVVPDGNSPASIAWNNWDGSLTAPTPEQNPWFANPVTWTF